MTGVARMCRAKEAVMLVCMADDNAVRSAASTAAAGQRPRGGRVTVSVEEITRE